MMRIEHCTGRLQVLYTAAGNVNMRTLRNTSATGQAERVDVVVFDK